MPPSSDLEYLTGIERDLPSFGNVSYAHGWVAEAFVAPGREPLFVLPRMVVDLHLDGRPPDGAIVVREDDDGRALFAEAVRSLPRAARLAIGARAWAETTIARERAAAREDRRRARGAQRLDSGEPTAHDGPQEGDPVLFDFGAVVDGYGSDFGRTVVAGEPPAGYADAHAAMLAAQEAGRAATTPDALARDVNAACRATIEDTGPGAGFRHRRGHGIGLDMHERPFISTEDATPLEAGMTFTDEPSILVDGRFGARIEDMICVADGAAVVL